MTEVSVSMRRHPFWIHVWSNGTVYLPTFGCIGSMGMVDFLWFLGSGGDLAETSICQT